MLETAISKPNQKRGCCASDLRQVFVWRSVRTWLRPLFHSESTRHANLWCRSQSWVWKGRVIGKIIFVFSNNSQIVDANLCFMYKLGQKNERILAIIKKIYLYDINYISYRHFLSKVCCLSSEHGTNTYFKVNFLPWIKLELNNAFLFAHFFNYTQPEVDQPISYDKHN